MTRQPAPILTRHLTRREPRQRHAQHVATALAIGAVLTGCGTAQLTGDTTTPADTPTETGTPTVTATPADASTRVPASSYPELDGYYWEDMPAAEWDQAWKVLSSDFGGTLASGEGRHVTDTDGNFIALVAVLTPSPENSSSAALKGIFDQQQEAVAENFGFAAVLKEPAHDVLFFTDAAGHPNWYWVSGDEFVVLVAPDTGEDHEGFYGLLCDRTL